MIKIVSDVVNYVVQAIGRVHWTAKKEISDDAKNHIKEMLKPDYYIVLTWRSNHLSSYFVFLANLVLTFKPAKYSHALMNFEGAVEADGDFRLIEAVGHGTTYTPFDKVFDVQRVALLKPKSMPIEDWTLVMDKAMTELGKPYDSLFDLKNDNALSCVELVRTALMADPDYASNFANFEKMIAKDRNLSPQMFRDCPDFEVVYEVQA